MFLKHYHNTPDWRPVSTGATNYTWNIQFLPDVEDSHWQHALVKAVNGDSPIENIPANAAAILEVVGLRQDRRYLHYRVTDKPIDWPKLYAVLNVLGSYLANTTQLFLFSESKACTVVIKRINLGVHGWHVVLGTRDRAGESKTIPLLWDQDVELL